MNARLTGGTYDGTVSNLNGLGEVQQEGSGLSRKKEARSSDCVVVDFPGEEASVGRGKQVRNDTGKTEVESLLGNFIEGEGFLNDFLHSNHFLACRTILEALKLNIPHRS
jgi:hypothetical protein